MNDTKVIYTPRATGKTTELLYRSHYEGGVIVVLNESRKSITRTRAEEGGFDVRVATIDEVIVDPSILENKYYIDDVGDVVASLLNTKSIPRAITATDYNKLAAWPPQYISPTPKPREA